MPEKKTPKMSAPDMLISPNSNIRGQGGKGSIVIDKQTSAVDGAARTKPNDGWGSSANGNAQPVPNGNPSY